MIRKGQACESATGTGSGLLHRFVLGTFRNRCLFEIEGQVGAISLLRQMQQRRPAFAVHPPFHFSNAL